MSGSLSALSVHKRAESGANNFPLFSEHDVFIHLPVALWHSFSLCTPTLTQLVNLLINLLRLFTEPYDKETTFLNLNS